MHNQARQWLLQMTAGLQPAQLVYNNQLGQLVLKFTTKKELYEGLIEPLMSQTVWKNGMGSTKQVVMEERVWSIAGLADVQIEYDMEQKVIQVAVTLLEADVEQTTEDHCSLAEIFGQVVPINFPQLEYTFSDDKSACKCG